MKIIPIGKGWVFNSFTNRGKNDEDSVNAYQIPISKDFLIKRNLSLKNKGNSSI